jgi:5'-3' exonuclease
MALMNGGVLRTDWKVVYYERYLGITTQKELDSVCKHYCLGLQWIAQYYTGCSVDQTWHFPWHLPPLWSDLADWLLANELGIPSGTREPLKPQEQLSLVLPKQSYWLVRDKNLRSLPSKLPQFWPSKFELFTAGHTQMWECEPCIPILTPERLRHVLNTTS